MTNDRATQTRIRWLETLDRYRRDPDAPGSADYWSPALDCASRDELRAIQEAKLAALTPFLYENSGFYRRRFERLGLLPGDVATLETLPRWPVVDKSEMMADVLDHPPYGTYTTHDDTLWRARGWMLFSSSGSSGVPRVFRYSHVDREYWSWANARAMHAHGIRPGDSALTCSGYGPHVFVWGVQFALAKMGVACVPGGGLTGELRATLVERFRPSVLVATVSYALHLARVMQQLGLDPARSSVRRLLVGGEPGIGIRATRERLEGLWGARMVEFYGCTEASPHCGGYSCPAAELDSGEIATHLMEDIQVWELVDPERLQPVPEGREGLTVCTCLNSESSAQLRFLVGDYACFTSAPCDCGRTHLRAVGSFRGRADDLINLRGIKMYPAQIEEAVRAVPGIGDEYEIVLATDADGLDTMTVRIEHTDAAATEQVAHAIRTRCEVRAGVELLAPGTLPKTEFKARRVRDERRPPEG